VTLILVIFCAEGNRRGVGFDKPQLGDKGPTCGCASMTSFGQDLQEQWLADPKRKSFIYFIE
jgi:hypothetical protein